MQTFRVSLAEGGGIRLHIPNHEGRPGEYSLVFPCSGKGMRAMRKILTERAAKEQPTGFVASHTQDLIEKWLLAEGNEVKRLENGGRHAGAVAEVVNGIDLSGLELTL